MILLTPVASRAGVSIRCSGIVEFTFTALFFFNQNSIYETKPLSYFQASNIHELLMKNSGG